MGKRVHYEYLRPLFRPGRTPLNEVRMLCGVPPWMNHTDNEQDVTCRRCLRILNNKQQAMSRG